MSFADKAISGFSQQATENMHTSFPALVVDYSEENHTATIQPLFMYDASTGYPQIQAVPVARWRFKIMKSVPNSAAAGEHSHGYTWTASSGQGSTQPAGEHTHTIEETEIVEEISLLLNPGDVVLCCTCEKSIDSISSKQVHDPLSKRSFDISDAVIVCILY